MKYFFLVFAAFYALITNGSNLSAEPIEIRFLGGKSAFLDESTPFDHTILAASVRFYLGHRLAIEPEFVYMKGPGSNRDYLSVPNLVLEVTQSGRGRVYLIGGAGLRHHTQKFPGAIDPEFSYNSWTVSGGLGGTADLNEHFFITGDFRIGIEPILRASAGVGYRFR